MSIVSVLATPKAAEIYRARIAARQSQEAAACFIEASARRWSDWETGARPMPVCKWTLYMLLTGQHPWFTLEPRPPGRRTGVR